MQFLNRWGMMLGILLLGSMSYAEDAAPVTREIALNQVVKAPGTYRAPGGTCEATLTRETGDVPLLSVMRGGTGKLSQPIGVHTNVNGLAWVSSSQFIFSALPGYGVPGLFSFSCAKEAKGKEKPVVRAKTTSGLDPEGTDFFELVSISNGKIHFYYVADADEMSVGDKPGPEMLYQVDLDGSHFQRAH